MPEKLPRTEAVFACQRRDPARQNIETQQNTTLTSALQRKKKSTERISTEASRTPVQIPAKPTFERRKTSRIKNDTAETPKTPEIKSKTPYTGVERRHIPNEIDAALDTARQLADQGDLREALQLCENVLAKKPGHVQTNFLKGLIYQASNNDTLAEEFFNRTVYLDPNHFEALNYLVFIAEQHGDKSKCALLRQRIERIQKMSV